MESPYGDPLAPTFLTPLLDDLSTSYVNGQRATCELDGVAVSCQRLLATSGDALAVEGRVGTRKHQFAVEKQVGQFRVPTRFTETRVRIGDHGEYGEHIIGATPTAWMVIDVSTYQQQIKDLHDHPKSLYKEAKDILKPKTDAALSDENCKNKLNKLLKELGYKGEINDLADSLYNNTDGYSLYITNEKVSPISRRGETDRKNKSIVLNRSDYKEAMEPLTFLHELLHTTKRGRFHTDIARKIAEMEGYKKAFDAYVKPKSSAMENQESSAFINSWLNENCFKGEVNGLLPWENIVQLLKNTK